MLRVYPVVLANVGLQPPSRNDLFFFGEPRRCPGKIRKHEGSSERDNNLETSHQVSDWYGNKPPFLES